MHEFENKVVAFSLIELMVVVAIVAILSAIAVPAYKNYTIKTQVVKGIDVLNKMRDKLISEYVKNGSLPSQYYFGDILFNVNTIRSIGISNVVRGEYWNIAAAPTIFIVCARLSGLDGTAGYVAPTPTTDGARNRICMEIIESTPGVFSTQCGSWNYPADTYDISPQYLPAIGCSCANVNTNAC